MLSVHISGENRRQGPVKALDKAVGLRVLRGGEDQSNTKAFCGFFESRASERCAMITNNSFGHAVTTDDVRCDEVDYMLHARAPNCCHFHLFCQVVDGDNDVYIPVRC